MQEIKPKIEESWRCLLENEFHAPYFVDLKKFLLQEKAAYVVYPPGDKIFSAFNLTPFHNLKVVIIGQDPYHGPGQANGLCFSVSPGIKKPPSLGNIFKEIRDDISIPVPISGNLEKWAKQGILLLNATLTVRANEAGSHQNKGWEVFTDSVIKNISENSSGIVFLLWGRFAHSKENLINASKHFVLKAAHPSPLARGAFFGCRHFSKTNEILINLGKTPINWSIE